jgi:predicted unusual protein kinase regulating ubiquinone biosynthesis (AarF/ABC1/UbiB family)
MSIDKLSIYIQDFLTIFQLFFVGLSETLLYFIFQDYANYIQRITTKLANINILYVKLFQAIASNKEWVNEKTNHELLKFTDNVPYTFYDIQIEDLIEIVDEYDLVLKDGYEKPINSGMISLVYKAYKRQDNTPIIIKMKRKNIDQKLKDAVHNINTILYLLSFFPIYQIAELVEKNIEMIMHQTNFDEEVKNILKIRENCKNLKYVKIPEVFSEITEKYPDFILMEYIEGKKIDQLEDQDYYGFSKQVLKFGLVTTIVHGCCHGDLHSGNILFIKDIKDKKYPYKVGIIDFGIIFEMDQEYKETLFDLLTQIFLRQPRDTIIQCLNSNLIEPPNILLQIPKEKYECIVELGSNLLKDAIIDKNASQTQVFTFFYKMKEYLQDSQLLDLGIRPSNHVVKTQMVLAMAHGVTLSLCKDKIFKIFEEVMNELFHVDMLTNLS